MTDRPLANEIVPINAAIEDRYRPERYFGQYLLIVAIQLLPFLVKTFYKSIFICQFLEHNSFKNVSNGPAFCDECKFKIFKMASTISTGYKRKKSNMYFQTILMSKVICHKKAGPLEAWNHSYLKHGFQLAAFCFSY